ncbi:hypothetical protein U1Q18_039085 [Sarracenia purpurea var. burkii]
MSKITALFVLSLLLISAAAHPGPLQVEDTPVKTHQSGEEAAQRHQDAVEESCEGVGDDEECLMRRTLAAHVDYIYTQNQNP